jgi:hypothetical protein
MDISQIDLSNLKSESPRDDHLIDLMTQAFRDEIQCTIAYASLDAIEPFSDFVPTISKDYRDFFNEELSKDTPPPLWVYAKAGKLIMSDHYYAYTMYKELKLELANCLVLGDTPKIKGVFYGESYYMGPDSNLRLQVLED